MSLKSFSPGVHKLIHHQEHLAKLEKREIVSPIHISVFPNIRCQLKCKYCCFKNENKDSSELSIEDFKLVVDVLTKKGLKALEFSGGGDPLLWTHFESAIEYAHSKNLKLSLVTNGLDLEKYKPELFSNFSWIRVSVQSASYAKKINLNHIPSNVKRSMSFIVYNQKSLEEIKNIYNFAKENNTIVRVAPNRPCEKSWEDEVVNEVSKYGNPLIFFRKEFGTPSGCYMVWLRAAIDWKGNFLPCPSMELSFESPGKLPEDFALCKIKDLENWLENNPVYDLGYRCTFCNCGKDENEYIHNLLQKMEDIDFV